MLKEYIIPALIYGIIAVVVGTISGFIAKMFAMVELPDACKEWNSKYVMQWSLFITGILMFFTIFVLKTQFKYEL
jgi:hypothetical protein